MSVKKYRIFCSTEQAFVTGYAETEPTTCFNNNTHTIDANQTAVVDIVKSDEPLKKYKMFSFTSDLPKNTTTEIPVIFNIDVDMYSVGMITHRNNVGDSYDIHVNKNTPVGIVTSSDTSDAIQVSATVIENVSVGFHVSVDGVNHYMVIEVGDVYIKLEEALSVTENSVVLATYFLIKDKKIQYDGLYSMGGFITGSYPITTSMSAGITYRNNTSEIKRLTCDIEVAF